MAPAAVLEVMCEPLLGFMLLTLRAMTIATGMVDAVVASTRVALIEAVAVEAAPALLDGTDDLAVCGGELGIVRYSGAKAVKISRRVVMTGVSLPEWMRCLVEKEDIRDASWKGANSLLPRQRLT